MTEKKRKAVENDFDLIRNIPSGVGVYDMTGDVIEMKYLKERYYQMIGTTGKNREQYEGAGTIEAIHPDDRPGLLQEAKAAINEKRIFQYRFRVLSENGDYIWTGIRANHRPLDSKTERFYAVYYNAYTYHREQIKLEQDKSVVTEIFDNIPGGVAIFSSSNDGIRLAYTNDGFYSLHHGSREYWRSVSDDPVYWLCEEDRHSFESEFLEVSSGRKPEGDVSYRVNGEDGRLHWVNNQFRFAYSRDGADYYYASFVSLDAEKMSEQEILKAQQMYDDATSTAKLIIWTYDINARRVELMQSGYTKKTCEKNRLPQVIDNCPDYLLPYVHEDDRRAFALAYEDISSGKDEVSVDFRFQLPAQSSMQHERMVLKRVKDNNGNLLTVYGYGQNITALKQKEEKFNRAHSRLNDPDSYGSFHLNLSKDWCGDGKKGSSKIKSVLDLQNSGTVNGYLDAFSRLIADENIQKKFHTIFERDLLLDQYEKGIERVSIEYPVIYANGERHWREGFLDMIENPFTGDIEGVSYSYDIDKRKRDELVVDRLINVNFDYIGLIHPATEHFEFINRKPAVTYGDIGRPLDYNKCCRYVGSRFTDISERDHFYEVVDLDSILSNLDGKDMYNSSYVMTTDGRRRCVRLEYCWLEKMHGDILVIRSDITEIYEQEQEYIQNIQKALLEAESANSAKSDFVSRISHDIRTPISAIIGMTRFAKEDMDDRQKLMEDLDKIEASNAFLLSLINDILDISKIDSGKIELNPEPYPFDEYIDKVRSMFEPLCAQKGLKFEVVVKRHEGACALVDKIRFNQITMNLMSNAVKYTPAGGSITYTSESEILADGMMRCKFTISDTGIGMSEEFQKTMFNAFAQETREYRQNGATSGTGLGLAIVKKIIDLMGGTIQVASRPGKGTSVTVTLPLSQAAEEDIAAAHKKSAYPGHDADTVLPVKLLLAEDNIINKEIAIRILESSGAELDHADNGLTAAEMFESSADGEYDAILMDIQMPVMNGYEAAEKIRAMSRPDAKTVPIIAMTADAFTGAAQQSIKAGMNDYITKPIDTGILISTLKKWIK